MFGIQMSNEIHPNAPGPFVAQKEFPQIKKEQPASLFVAEGQPSQDESQSTKCGQVGDPLSQLSILNVLPERNDEPIDLEENLHEQNEESV